MAEVDPIDVIYEKARLNPDYRKQLNKELDAFGMPWLKAPEPSFVLPTPTDDDQRGG